MKYYCCLFLFFIPFYLLAQSLPIFQGEHEGDDDIVIIEENTNEVLPGCSWYCGGFVSDFKASSILKANKDITYFAKNAHDFDIATAWVEGSADEGVGQYLEYIFDMNEMQEPHHLGVTQIILANGYKKSRKAWTENSRVKTMKMYVDGKPYAILKCLDSFEFQTIDIGEIMLPQQKVMKIRFKIMEVYPGSKYKDTAITELLFDGVGVH
jgi:hypothetical protein